MGFLLHFDILFLMLLFVLIFVLLFLFVLHFCFVLVFQTERGRELDVQGGEEDLGGVEGGEKYDKNTLYDRKF